MIYNLDQFIIDTVRFEVVRGGEEVVLQPKAKRLLIALVEADGALVTKAKIIDELWDGRAISDSALSSQVKALRKALGDTDRPYRIIGTAHGEGFRILAPIEKAGAAVPAQVSPVGEEAEQPVIGERPRIAVLPFRTIGTDRYAPLTEALPDEIITALSRSRSMHVLARGSSFQFPSLTSDLAAVREKLDVQYCLSGSIEEAGERLVIRVELADTRDGSVVWSNEFEAPREAIHEIRSDIVGQVVAGIDFRTPLHEMERLRLIVPDKLSAWENYHVGISNVFSLGRPDYVVATDHFRRAIAIDPWFSRAHAGLSHVNWWQMVQQNQDIGAAAREEMFRAADEAVAADPLDPFASLVRGRSAWLAGRIEEAITWFKRSINLSPSYGMAHGAMANLNTLIGRPDVAMPHVEQAIHLSPIDPWRHNMYAVQAALFLQQGRFEEAAKATDNSMVIPHDSLIVLQCGVVAYHFAGRGEDADRLAKLIIRANPNSDLGGSRRAIPVNSEAFRKLQDDAFAAHGLA
ncbi:winged helix-turn-helix domain-containing protein [Qipengyuania sp. 1NDH17]|uniref:Winged helix-turn-helix domain-containing protein n=1 Tax=Qipengyuania polymorpha TaxID=2867234 RepID=A0ABS7J0F6_9SPHN|nr:winged helix-turn-helix domain-containing protein [Qipengyuania polymorpha]MBX7456908.1 winged helix-turn-helix domain-containing protein [Qipengyuania polymorpha]